MGMPSWFVFCEPDARTIKFNVKKFTELADYNLYLGGYEYDDEEVTLYEVIMNGLNDSKMMGYFVDEYLKQIFDFLSIFKRFQPNIERIRIHFHYIEDIMYYYEITGDDFKIVWGKNRDSRYYNLRNDEEELDENDIFIKKYLEIMELEEDTNEKISCKERFPNILEKCKFEMKKHLFLSMF